MDSQTAQNEKNKRIKGRSFWFLFAFQMPILAMWMSGYKGYLLPAWLALDWLFIAYFRARTTTYTQRLVDYSLIGQANAEIRAYQERPWYFLLPIPLWVGSTAMIRLATTPGADQGIVRASSSCLVLIVIVCLIEGIRKIRI